MEEPDRPQMSIWRMRIACWIPKTTKRTSAYAVITAFPTNQWMHEQASVLRDT